MNSNVRSAMAGAVAGGLAMYLLDPEGGGRRRALLRDKATWAARKTRDAADATRRDVGNRLNGLAAHSRVAFSDAPADDATVRERIHSALGRATRHHRAVSVAVTSGNATLTGDALASEVPSILSTVKHVRGVENVDNQLRTHDSPEGIPVLQGGESDTRSWAAWATSGWSPAALAGTAAGVAIIGAAALAAGRTARKGDGATDASWTDVGDAGDVCVIEVDSLTEP